MKTLEEKFWEKVKKTDDCWIWIGADDGRNGYGHLRHNGHTDKAHRVSWQIHYGRIAKGLYICHKCDNPSCVNPLHLFLGTQSDNMIDMVKKGRLVPRINKPTLERFWKKVDKKSDNECWNLIGKSIKSGKAKIRYIGKLMQVHRFSWLIHFGEIPENLLVLHKCDNLACVNPNHLFLGTAKDQVHNTLKKGRHKSGNKKLTDNDIDNIRQMAINGNSQNLISEKYNIHYSYVNSIIHNKRRIKRMEL